MDKKEDNPVPSLEREIYNLINDYEDFFDYREDVKSEIRSRILKLFQNGVETLNEQPKSIKRRHSMSDL